MAKVPGDPNAKEQLVSGLTPKSFPHLVADILFHRLGHKDVRIVDGPGDGRRDVHSVFGRKRHITQCKYHSGAGSVSARETDELPTALVKFGLSQGLFATTGRLSPQACREYLDNFPGLSLDWMDLDRLVDEVLSDPILSAVWFNGAEISDVSRTIAIPFTLRRADDHRPVDIPDAPEFALSDALRCRLERRIAPTFAMRPYRWPSRATSERIDDSTMWCSHGVFRGAVRLHELSPLVRHLAEAVQRIVSTDQILQLRIGSPYIADPDSESPGGTVVGTVRPTSWVMTQDSVVPEQDWLLPSSQDWVLPTHLSVADADEACWHNAELDIWFRVEVNHHLQWEDLPLMVRMMHGVKRDALAESLFVTGTSDACDKAAEIDPPPQFRCEWGPGGGLVGWLHPVLVNEFAFAYTRRTDGGLEPQVDDALKAALRERRDAVTEQLANLPLTEVDWKKAAQIALAADRPLLSEEATRSSTPAELTDHFNAIPVPTELGARDIMWIQIFDVDRPAEDVAETLELEWSRERGDGFHDHWLLRRKGEGGTWLMMTTGILQVGSESTTQSLLDQRDRWLPEVEEIAREVRRLFPKAVLATGRCWNEAIRQYPAMGTMDGRVITPIQPGDTPDDVYERFHEQVGRVLAEQE